MPSSYTTSARYTLQATGENNNTWGVILNAGVFQLVDDNVNGRLAFALSGVKVLTTALGGTDEARMAFLDVTGGTGGTVTVPAVSQGHFVRNAAAGDVVVSAGGAVSATFKTQDCGPIFADGANVYPILLSGMTVRDYITAAISGAVINLPPPLGNLGKALIVRDVLGVETWLPDFIQITDVQGLQSFVETTAEDLAVAFALTL